MRPSAPAAPTTQQAHSASRRLPAARLAEGAIRWIRCDVNGDFGRPLVLEKIIILALVNAEQLPTRATGLQCRNATHGRGKQAYRLRICPCWYTLRKKPSHNDGNVQRARLQPAASCLASSGPGKD
jgi:hypothetical protein